MLGIAHRHGTTLDHLLRLNPGMNPDYVQSGQVVKVPSAHPQAAAKATPAKSTSPAVPHPAENITTAKVGEAQQQPKPIITYKEYKVKRKDTAYSIAKANDITVDELVAANPAMAAEGHKLKKGTIIRIPVKTYPPKPVYEGLQTIRVAVILPFVGNGVENVRSVEFYRGMLMGIDDLKQAGVNITVSAYGEPSPEESVARLMNEVMQGKPDVIVGPLYPTHFADVTEVSGKKTKVAVPFSSKVPQVEYRQEVFVVNTPAAYEATLAADLFMKSFKKQTRVVILHTAAGNKKTFADELRRKLLEANYEVVSLPAASSAEQIKSALGGKNKENVLIVPDDAGEATLKQLLPKLDGLRKLLPQVSFSLLGYEQWIPLSEGEYRNPLHEADAYLLTSNYFYPYTAASMAFVENYKRWFKTSLLESRPRMAPLGYDFSRAFLGGMATYGYDYATQSPLEGTVAAQPALQTDLRFSPVAAGGYVSRSMWLVHFKKDKSIVKIAAQ